MYKVNIFRPMFGQHGGPSEVENYHVNTLFGALIVVLRKGRASRFVTETRIARYHKAKPSN